MKETETNQIKQTNGVTWRAILLVGILLPINAFWVNYTESIIFCGCPSLISIFYNVIAYMLLFRLYNSVALKRFPRFALTPHELITIYILLGISTAVSSSDLIIVLVSVLAFPKHSATVTNRWAEILLPYIPKWLYLRDDTAIANYFAGDTLYRWVNIKAWLIPVLWWTALLFLVGFSLLLLANLFRYQWARRENLSYPLAQVPLELVNENSPMLRGRAFWAGFAITIIFGLLIGVNAWFPNVPYFRTYILDTRLIFTNEPWNSLGVIRFGIYPFAIGLAFLIPVDLLLSICVFFLFWKIEPVMGTSIGLNALRGFPFTRELTFGSLIGISLLSIWNARAHLLAILKAMLFGRSKNDDIPNVFECQYSGWGFLVCQVLILILCLNSGISLWLIVGFFAIYYLLGIALSRLRAEVGAPAIDISHSGPDMMLPEMFGSKTMTKTDLAFLCLSYGYNRAYRPHFMPLYLEGNRIAEKTSTDTKKLFCAMAIMTFVGLLFGWWVTLDSAYRYGANTALIAQPNSYYRFGEMGWLNYNRMYDGMQPNQNSNYSIVIGMIFTFILYAARLRFVSMPIQPIGFAVASTWSIYILWFSIFIAWVVKASVLKSGGLKLYRAFMPFFFGLIIGDCSNGIFWTIITLTTKVKTYQIFP